MNVIILLFKLKFSFCFELESKIHWYPHEVWPIGSYPQHCWDQQISKHNLHRVKVGNSFQKIPGRLHNFQPNFRQILLDLGRLNWKFSWTIFEPGEKIIQKNIYCFLWLKHYATFYYTYRQKKCLELKVCTFL